ncbi:hypothetical protein EVAR_85760_1 [Eumeta japonica]|uniref:Uncharacterized protein n=1 Tax=Eumeta variegata TaxID=151549 RepID=A0A4C1ZJ36_EUMVA|nr:hypothetical protein EVAR_85760_1 [Eumeta japonica]
MQLWAGFASSGVMAQTVKAGYFVLLHGAGIAYIPITTFKKSRLRTTLSFSMPISAAVVARDRRVSIYFNRQSIVIEEHPLRQYLSIKDKYNCLERFPDSGVIHHRLIVKTP